MEILPKEIQWNIIKFMRHPTAELVKESDLFKFRFHKSNQYRNGPFDMGSRDAYYYRERCPNILQDRLKVEHGKYYDVKIEGDDLTAEEIEAYYYGFDYQEDFK
jgi:hypothetical protein